MIIDKETEFADNLAFGGTPAVIDTGVGKPGPGKAINCFFVAHSALTGCTGIEVLDGTTSSPATNRQTQEGLPPVGQIIEFKLPSDTLRYVTIALLGTVSAGAYSSGIVMEGVQTAE